MALSDIILGLGRQAKTLEESAAALHAENDLKLQARVNDLRDSLSDVEVELGDEFEAESLFAVSRWARLQRAGSDAVDALRIETLVRVDGPAMRTDDVAARAELDAEGAIDFAVYALRQAEYYALAALAAVADDDDLGEADLDTQTDGEPADGFVLRLVDRPAGGKPAK